jgi:hypothetical protein
LGITVYHGSILEVKKPDVSFSKNYLDFGKGFYVTTFRKQAEKWAFRRGLRTGNDAILNVYSLDENFKKSKVLTFKDDETWLDFVCACRKGDLCYKQYDIIIGNIADDDVFKSIDMYFRGLWDKKRTIEELKYYKKNDQIAFVSQSAIDKYLDFVSSYKVNSYEK